LLISVALHAGLIAGTYMTWRNVIAPPEESHSVPVDLVTVAQETNVMAQAPPPPDKIVPPAPTVEQPPLPEFSEVEPAPEPPVPQFKIKPEKKDDADKPDKAKAQDFAALLNKLAAPAAPPKNAKTSTRTVQGIGAQNMMTADLADSLKSQIYQCWSPPVGAPNAADLVVSFELHLNHNGTVAGLQMTPETIARAASNPYTRAASEAASRAIYQCQNQGYRLPQDRYGEWSDINPLRFDPRQMMNQ
jgi:hypothetical protein